MDAEGFTIVEPLILFVVLLIVSSGTAVMIDSINRNATNSRLQIKVNEDIESDIATVRGVADRLTCCSGTCVVATLNASGLATFPSVDTGTATSSCATNNPRSGAFFFPTRDDITTTGVIAPTTSAREPDAVTQVCSDNTVTSPLMTPLLTAVNALPNPPAGQNFYRAAAIQQGKVLRVTYTDTINSTVARVVNIVPPMANFCT